MHDQKIILNISAIPYLKKLMDTSQRLDKSRMQNAFGVLDDRLMPSRKLCSRCR